MAPDSPAIFVTDLSLIICCCSDVLCKSTCNFLFDFVFQATQGTIVDAVYPQFVKIVEVGPRDGLQNEPIKVPTNIKIELINRLVDAGLCSVEATRYACVFVVVFSF